MFSLRRWTLRTAGPAAFGLAVVMLSLVLLAAMPAAAQPVSLPPDRSPELSRQPAGALQIPLTKTPTLDGRCTPAEYPLALKFNDWSATGAPVSGTVYLAHDNVNFYVCIQGAMGPNPARFASVYLDTFDDRSPYADANDYALHADIVTGTQSSYHGTGVANGYVPFTLNNWLVKTTTGNFDQAEYQIPLSLTGGWCQQPFGLAVYHHWVAGTGNDYGWPSNHWFDQPPTWTEVQFGSLAPCSAQGNIAYIYQRDTATGGAVKTLLESAGFTVTLIPLSAVTTTNFTPYHELIVADDTGDLNQWGSAAQVQVLTSTGKPILGLGEGGYAFFGKLGSYLGWPNGWHGPQASIFNPTPPPSSYYVDPYNLSGLLDSGAIPLYSATSNEVAIYVPGQKPPGSDVVLGWEPPSTPQGSFDHAPLMIDGSVDTACYQLWGFSAGPQTMNETGQRLFINAVVYGRFHTACRQLPPPPTNCVTLVKTAQPPSGSTVHPGDAITYTLTYTVAAGCATPRALLFDQLPAHTLFVPNSASDGKTPNSEYTLMWNLGGTSAGTTVSKTLSVSVLDTACRAQVVTDTARLQTDSGLLTSNATTHFVQCPPVVPPNEDPPYAESEIQTYPYPLVTGAPTHLSVRVFNNDTATHTVTVTFQTSPNRFGIGIPFSAITVPGNPRVITIGGGGYAEVVLDWTPISSGHYCIQVKIESAGYAPIYTYRNLDVTEDLRPGKTDVLTFSVMNPLTATANINLVVDNTCPGWSAEVSPTLISPAVPGTLYTATLSVIPPNPATLGTGCHIDVQGWIGSQLIGGIRKLDVPPVNLPHADPAWLEKEISTIPDPAVISQTNQACIELQNPLIFTRVVTITFSEAAFGAGIGFTPFATQTFTLPPTSLQKYCVSWTPLGVATLHRCLLVTLHQPGFQDQTSQHNVNLVRRTSGWDPGSVRVPFSIGNPFPFTSKLNLNGILIGLNHWTPKFLPDPPPDLMPGEIWNGELVLAPAMSQLHGPTAGADTSIAGDVARVDVSVSFNDEPYSGFSVDFAPPLFSVYLPLIMK